jgi:hypothetical protein
VHVVEIHLTSVLIEEGRWLCGVVNNVVRLPMAISTREVRSREVAREGYLESEDTDKYIAL